MPSTLFCPNVPVATFTCRDVTATAAGSDAGPSPRPAHSGAQVLAFRAAKPSADARLAQALTDAAARRPDAAGALYDVINTSVYRLILAITGDEPAAERATVATFVEIWQRGGDRPLGADMAWVLDVACRCARATMASDWRLARRLHVVPTG